MDFKKCPECDDVLGDGVHCHACGMDLHFQCAGITEAGYRKLGERKSVWRCANCKQAGIPLQPPSDTLPPVSPTTPEQVPASLLLSEIRCLAAKFTTLETLPQEVKSLKEEFVNLQSIVKAANESLACFATKICGIEERLTKLENAKNDQGNAIMARLDKIEEELREKEQWSRASNIEIKGVKETKNENLFNIVSAVGSKINYPIQKAQINFVTRVPTRDPNQIKPIIVSFNNRYIKEDIVAAARATQKVSPLVPTLFGFEGKNEIYINDHLTTENKILLNKTKKFKQEKGFQFLWVKHCKIYLRKSDTSPVIHIKSEKSLSKLTLK